MPQGKKRFALKEKLLCLKKLQRCKGLSSISPSSRLLQEMEAGSLKIFPSHLKAEGRRRMEREHCQISQPHYSWCGRALLNSSTVSTKRSWPSLTLLERHFGTSTSNWSRGQLRAISPRSYLLVPNSSTLERLRYQGTSLHLYCQVLGSFWSEENIWFSLIKYKVWGGSWAGREGEGIGGASIFVIWQALHLWLSSKQCGQWMAQIMSGAWLHFIIMN